MDQDRIRVLSVDDHVLLREGIAMIINHQTDMVLVSQASGGREAIQQYREYRPDASCVELELEHPDGRKLKIKSENVSQEQLDQTMKIAQEFFGVSA
jgi:DNA-binding NarL/FixJ family response regulator